MSSEPEREHTAADELALHAEWLRRLARALAGDEAEAEDVAQATWERVLDDRVAGGFRLRPLLARVARTLAWRRRRTDSRRRGRERAAARRDVWPSAAEIAARGELAERLAQALDALDESQRTVIVMRYFDGSSSAEIARQLGLPAATVRSRLKRGLEELRVRLGSHRDEGGGPSWVVLARGAKGETAPAATVGGFGLLAGTTMVAVAATAAVWAGWGLWSVTTDVSPSLALEVAAAEDEARGRGTAETSVLDDLQEDPARVHATAEAETPPGRPVGWWLSGRILGLAPQDAEEAHFAVSGAQGRTRFLAPKATPEGALEIEISSLFLEEQSGLTELWVEFDHPSYMPEAWRLPIGQAERQAGEFQGVATVLSFQRWVERVPTYVTGRVRVPPGYDPALVSVALVALDAEGEPLEHAVAVEDCDAEGEFRLRTDRSGPHFVVALHQLRRSQSLRPAHAWVEVEGARVELPQPLVMDPGATIEGRVALLPGSLPATPLVQIEFDAQDAPVIRAGRDLRWIEGRFDYWYSTDITADAQGRFRLEGLRPGNHSLRVIRL
ncbi:MAG: RNA polymerase sigma factor, partial [Planctomycetota bacterium]